MFLRSDQCGVAPRGMANCEPTTAKPRIGFLQHGVSRRVTYAPSLFGAVCFSRYSFGNPDTQHRPSLVQFNEHHCLFDIQLTHRKIAGSCGLPNIWNYRRVKMQNGRDEPGRSTSRFVT
jgi:hypothetical protein